VTTRMSGSRARMSGSRYVGLYPRAWRERYGDELQDVLERERLGIRARLDLVRGAVDAHLHPLVPSRLPVLAAVTASALAVAHAIALAAQPVATDWPGYQEEALPLIIGSVAAGIPAIIGLWLRLGDGDGVLGRLGVVLALVGHAAWLTALVAAIVRIAYGPLTGAVAAVAMTGMALLGVALVGRGRLVLGVLVALVGLAGVAPPAWGWAALAAAWTGVAIILVLEPPRDGIPLGGARRV
jgi:hypothetical protein